MRVALLRYDTEHNDTEQMAGFLEAVARVHRADDIPVTLFCTGAALEARRGQFQAFAAEIAGDERIDLQDHSYTHIGIGYEAGQPLDVLRADYARSFAAHESVLGKRPTGTAICGTSGRDGNRLPGFDATDKGRAELDMLVGLGLRMINTHLSERTESREFCSYAALGHPDVMGFPSGLSDTGWLKPAATPEAGVEAILQTIDERAKQPGHLALICHDWCAWQHAPDRDLTHVRRIADRIRHHGYILRTHASCYHDHSLWK